MDKKLVGRIAHFYPKISVAVVELSDDLREGDRIAIEGKGSVEQVVESMQLEHDIIALAKAGQAVGLRVAERVFEGDSVYKLII